MSSKKIIVLHEYGANSHYRSLKYLLDENNIEIQFYEFSIMKKLLKSIFRLDFSLFNKQFLNIRNLLNLSFSENKDVLLGIAPYDYRLYFLLFILRNHNIYYHTSWPSWNDLYYPKTLFYSKTLLQKWQYFLNKHTKHIFAVTQSTKEQLILYKHIDPLNISVVYHSFDSNIYYPNDIKKIKKKISFLFVGRLTEEKGLKKILNFFSTTTQDINIHIVGDGDLKSDVVRMARKYHNITFHGYIKDKKQLANIYRDADYLILPSIKQDNWEELFGMVMIEAMACGVVPIATNHIGPTEVIKHNVNGVLMTEDNFEPTLLGLISKHTKYYLVMRHEAIESSKKFSLQKISLRWSAIIKTDKRVTK